MESRTTPAPATSQSGLTTKGIFARLGASATLSALPAGAIALTTDGFIHMGSQDNNEQRVNNDLHVWVAFGLSMSVLTLIIFAALYKCALGGNRSRPSNGYLPVSTEDHDVEEAVTASIPIPKARDEEPKWAWQGENRIRENLPTKDLPREELLPENSVFAFNP